MTTVSRIAGSLAVVLAAVSFLATAVVAGEKENLAELEKLAGSWKMTSIENNGNAAPPQALERFKKVDIVIKGYSMTFLEEGKAVQELTISVAADQSPKTIDIKGAKAGTKGGKEETALGIYVLEGKTLKLCTDDRGKQRPKEFSSKGEGISLLVLDRK